MRTYTNTHNPVLPLDIHIPDSEAHVMPDGKLYLYGSFDDRDDVFCSTQYRVASTPDLCHWTIHDCSLRGEDIRWFDNPAYPHYPGIDWSHPTPFVQRMLAEHAGDKEKFEKQKNEKKPPLLFAPDCLYHDGKYYLYFCMSDDTEGVATSDKPEGPFTNPVQLPIGGIDPAVFEDRDGSVYLYWGQLYSHGVKLHDDLVSLDRNAIRDDLVTEQEHFFHEGSSMRRIGDTYYYVFAGMQRGKPTSLGYATGPSPFGPFTYRGILIDNADCDPESWNNHGSIECFHGQWYVFYHRASRGTQQHRRLCMEPITIREDGSIPEVKMTSQGAGKPFAPGETIMGYQSCGVHGGCFVDTDPDCGEILTHIGDGNTAVFRYIESDDPWHQALIRCRGTGTITVRLKTEDGQVASEGKALADGSGTAAATLDAAPGKYEVELLFAEPDGLFVESITLE